LAVPILVSLDSLFLILNSKNMSPLPIKKPQKQSYLRRMLSFYFAPVWQSFFTILYFVFFFYFSVFHSGKVIVALNFVATTFIGSTSILTLDYLYWGVIFLISLIIPFSLSLYALLLFYEVWKGNWETSNKFLMTITIMLTVPLVIMLMDNIIRTAGQQEALRTFIEANNLLL